MRPPLNPKPMPVDAPIAESRRRGRFRCMALNCWVKDRKFGKVCDLSASGMRVKRHGRRRAKEGEVLTLDVEWNDLQATVDGRVVWVRKLGFLRYVIGVEFVNLSDEQREAVGQLARLSRDDGIILSPETDKERNDSRITA